MAKQFRLVALISGGGTTLQNLIDRISAGRLAAEIAGVVSSRADAFGVERAKKAGLPVAVVERANGRRQPAGSVGNHQPADAGRSPGFAEEVWAAVRSFAPDLVVFAGWLHLLPIPADFHHRVLNIHPALLPAFGGRACTATTFTRRCWPPARR